MNFKNTTRCVTKEVVLTVMAAGSCSHSLFVFYLFFVQEAVRIILDKSPSILGDFCVCAIREGDLESWKLILQEIKRKENDTRGKDIKIYQQYTNGECSLFKYCVYICGNVASECVYGGGGGDGGGVSLWGR